MLSCLASGQEMQVAAILLVAAAVSATQALKVRGSRRKFIIDGPVEDLTAAQNDLTRLWWSKHHKNGSTLNYVSSDPGLGDKVARGGFLYDREIQSGGNKKRKWYTHETKHTIRSHHNTGVNGKTVHSSSDYSGKRVYENGKLFSGGNYGLDHAEDLSIEANKHSSGDGDHVGKSVEKSEDLSHVFDPIDETNSHTISTEVNDPYNVKNSGSSENRIVLHETAPKSNENADPFKKSGHDSSKSNERSDSNSAVDINGKFPHEYDNTVNNRVGSDIVTSHEAGRSSEEKSKSSEHQVRYFARKHKVGGHSRESVERYHENDNEHVHHYQGQNGKSNEKDSHSRENREKYHEIDDDRSYEHHSSHVVKSDKNRPDSFHKGEMYREDDDLSKVKENLLSDVVIDSRENIGKHFFTKKHKIDVSQENGQNYPLSDDTSKNDKIKPPFIIKSDENGGFGDNEKVYLTQTYKNNKHVDDSVVPLNYIARISENNGEEVKNYNLVETSDENINPHTNHDINYEVDELPGAHVVHGKIVDGYSTENDDKHHVNNAYLSPVILDTEDPYDYPIDTINDNYKNPYIVQNGPNNEIPVIDEDLSIEPKDEHREKNQHIHPNEYTEDINEDIPNIFKHDDDSKIINPYIKHKNKHHKKPKHIHSKKYHEKYKHIHPNEYTQDINEDIPNISEYDDDSKIIDPYVKHKHKHHKKHKHIHPNEYTEDIDEDIPDIFEYDDDSKINDPYVKHKHKHHKKHKHIHPNEYTEYIDEDIPDIFKYDNNDDNSEINNPYVKHKNNNRNKNKHIHPDDNLPITFKYDDNSEIIEPSIEDNDIPPNDNTQGINEDIPDIFKYDNNDENSKINNPYVIHKNNHRDKNKHLHPNDHLPITIKYDDNSEIIEPSIEDNDIPPNDNTQDINEDIPDIFKYDNNDEINNPYVIHKNNHRDKNKHLHPNDHLPITIKYDDNSEIIEPSIEDNDIPPNDNTQDINEDIPDIFKYDYNDDNSEIINPYVNYKNKHRNKNNHIHPNDDVEDVNEDIPMIFKYDDDSKIIDPYIKHKNKHHKKNKHAHPNDNIQDNNEDIPDIYKYDYYDDHSEIINPYVKHKHRNKNNDVTPYNTGSDLPQFIIKPDQSLTTLKIIPAPRLTSLVLKMCDDSEPKVLDVWQKVARYLDLDRDYTVKNINEVEDLFKIIKAFVKLSKSKKFLHMPLKKILRAIRKRIGKDNRDQELEDPYSTETPYRGALRNKPDSPGFHVKKSVKPIGISSDSMRSFLEYIFEDQEIPVNGDDLLNMYNSGQADPGLLEKFGKLLRLTDSSDLSSLVDPIDDISVPDPSVLNDIDLDPSNIENDRRDVTDSSEKPKPVLTASFEYVDPIGGDPNDLTDAAHVIDYVMDPEEHLDRGSADVVPLSLYSKDLPKKLDGHSHVKKNPFKKYPGATKYVDVSPGNPPLQSLSDNYPDSVENIYTTTKKTGFMGDYLEPLITESFGHDIRKALLPFLKDYNHCKNPIHDLLLQKLKTMVDVLLSAECY